MDLNEYNELRERISKKNFEGKNRKLDKWLYTTTFFANGVSIFFAFFVLYPALQGSFLMNIGNELISNIAAILFSVGFLVAFEVIKRYLIRNFSFDYIWKNIKGVATKTWLWFFLVLIIIGISFYLSMSGARNFASRFEQERTEQRTLTTNVMDSITNHYNERISFYEIENRELSNINIGYRERMSELPDNFITARREFQGFIRENEETIERNREIISNYRKELANELKNIEEELTTIIDERRVDDLRTIFLFIIIVALNESLIVLGIYFREYFEHQLYKLYNKNYEVSYQKRRYYQKMLKYLYGGGVLNGGDRVSGLEDLENEIIKKTKLENPSGFVSEFNRYLKRMGIIIHRRGELPKFGKNYEDALKIVESLQDNIIEIEQDI